MRRASVLVTLAAVLVVACGTRQEPLREGHIDLGISTTTSTDPCETAGGIERAVTEASLTAGRADAERQQALNEELDRLAALVPPSLTDDVDSIRATFDTVFEGAPAGTDPFEDLDYVNADQAIRRWVEAGCESDP